MKTKKRTRAQILERLHEIAYDTENIKKYVEFPETHKYITVVNILNKGETVSEAHCHNCGEKYLRKPIFSSYAFSMEAPQRFQCPKCGNTHVTNSRSDKFEEKRRKLILKTEDGFEFVTFVTYETHDKRDDWYERESMRGIDIKTAGVFDRNSGFYIAERGTPTYWNNEKEYKVLRRLSNDERSIVFWLKDFTDSNMSDDECRELLKESKEYYQRQQKDSEARSEAKREKKEEAERLAREARARAEELRKQEYEAMRLADKRWMYEAKPVDVESAFSHPVFYSLYSTFTNSDVSYIVGCAKCGHAEERIGIDVIGKYTCPYCGNHVEHMTESCETRTQTAIVFENTVFEENDLLIRVFKYKCGMNRKHEIVRDVYESKRIFAGKELRVYRKLNDRFEKDEDSDNLRLYINDGIVLTQSNDEIVEIIQRSCLKYSGLLDAWGLGKFKYNWGIDMPDLSYLKAWYVNPGIEIVMKSNLTDITDRLVDAPEHMHSGKYLHEILGIHSGVVKMIQKSNTTLGVMNDLNRMYEADNTMTLEIYNKIVEEDLNRNIMKTIALNHGIAYDKILTYLQTAYDHQCIVKNECLRVWSDYLSMASRIGVNLADKSKKFPSSLKKEHDIAMFAYNAVRVEIDKKLFAEQAKINAKYAFEDDDMIVLIPQSPQEVIEEANHQNNCLRSYVERVKRGETVVAFVRKKDAPEKTFLSAEIYNGELIQLKGWCNSDPRTKEIVGFMKKWAEACDITIKC